MASRMRSLLKLSTRKKKAQFFVLSAFVIVGILLLISSWIQPYTIVDTSSIVLMQEPFVFNNVKEKAIQTVQLSKSCDDLRYNIDEYANFVNQYSVSKNLNLKFNYSIAPCFDSLPNPVAVVAKMEIKTSTIDLASNFTMYWVPSK